MTPFFSVKNPSMLRLEHDKNHCSRTKGAYNSFLFSTGKMMLLLWGEVKKKKKKNILPKWEMEMINYILVISSFSIIQI